MPIPNESQIRSRIEAFASELVQLVQASALSLVNEALGGSPTPGRGRRARSVRRGALASARRKGAKRDPKELAALTEKLGAFIAKNSGKRIEEIGQALGTTTKELALPVKKLIAAKRISTKGQKRATRYFAR